MRVLLLRRAEGSDTKRALIKRLVLSLLVLIIGFPAYALAGVVFLRYYFAGGNAALLISGLAFFALAASSVIIALGAGKKTLKRLATNDYIHANTGN
ncbi:MAG: hypothetical protein WBL47_06660 [Bacilli bacterium]|jgi:hypothetical protein|nr:hypothetical protein [Bacillota bacterium]HOA78571.1 hypothetical protein [Bacilli bacterium]HPZ27224.1 hypothetical protein [Bacilli bacterium]HQC89657.1 hypothetical protein [Bacilli bacterium]